MKRILFSSAFLAMVMCGNAQVEVTSNGDLGIGTNNPTQKLHVVGNSFLNGNLGIGRDNPIYKLDVNGTAFFGTRYTYGNLQENGVKIGTYSPPLNNCYFGSAPAIYNPKGNNNLFFGIPTAWAYCTYSSNYYYTNHYHYSIPTDVIPCNNTMVLRITNLIKQTDVFTGVLQPAVLVNRGGSELDSNSLDSNNYRGDGDCPGQRQYLFLADQLQTVFPELVTVYEDGEEVEEGDEPKLAINYMGMIPVLTLAVKEQQGEIEVLQDIVFGQELDLTELNQLRDRVAELEYIVDILLKNCCKDITIPQHDYRDSNRNNNNNNIQQSPVLYQNTPNPFTSNTEISCDIPNQFTSAFIYIYNLQGVELMSFPILQTGYNTVIVYASALPAGMYLYTLVVDNQIIDSKRMILTK